jgi:hypothetical protein
MAIGAIGSQTPVQLYQNQAGATPASQDNTDKAAARDTESARVDISQKARELQAQKDADAAKQTADDRRAEAASQAAENTQPQPGASAETRQSINLTA